MRVILFEQGRGKEKNKFVLSHNDRSDCLTTAPIFNHAQLSFFFFR